MSPLLPWSEGHIARINQGKTKSSMCALPIRLACLPHSVGNSWGPSPCLHLSLGVL